MASYSLPFSVTTIIPQAFSDERPAIKHREFDSLDRAYNTRLDDDTYHRRTVIESVFTTLKQRYGDRLKARTRYGQFRELALKAAVKNVEDGIGASHYRFRAFQHAPII